jgi:hypothetical protein
MVGLLEENNRAENERMTDTIAREKELFSRNAEGVRGACPRTPSALRLN